MTPPPPPNLLAALNTHLYGIVLTHRQHRVVSEVEVIAADPSAPEVRVPAVAGFLPLKEVLRTHVVQGI